MGLKSWWEHLPAAVKAMGIICIVIWIGALISFIVAFLFENSALAKSVDSWGSDANVDTLFVLLRNCALAGSISCLIVNSVGLIGAAYHSVVIIILYIVGCGCCIIILLVNAIIPAVSAAIVQTACTYVNNNCYECPEGVSDSACQEANVNTGGCFYSAQDYDAFCVDFRSKLWLIAADFFILAFLSFVNAILSCVAAAARRKQKVTVLVHHQQPTVVMTQQQPTPVVIVQQNQPLPQYVYTEGQQQPQMMVQPQMVQDNQMPGTYMYVDGNQQPPPYSIPPPAYT